jgi:hypothetical protein
MLIVGYCFGIHSKRDSAKRSTSIWHTAGSAGSDSTTMSPIMPPSRIPT